MPSIDALLPDVAAKTKSATPPLQWIFLIILAALTFIAGWFVSTEINQRKQERVDLDKLKIRIDEYKVMAEAEKVQEKAASYFRAVANMEAELVEREAAWALAMRDAKAREKAVEDARNWKELSDA